MNIRKGADAMMDAALDEALAELFAAEGLGAKQAVLTCRAALLLTAAAEARLSDGEFGQSGAADGSEIHAALIALCREQGPDAGRAAFAGRLVDFWLGQPGLAAKADLLAAWSDPLLSDAMRDWLVFAADRAESPDQVANLRWHARLVERCREQGLAAGLAAHQAADGDPPGDSAADATDPAALIAELQALARENRPENWLPMATILETLLVRLPPSGPSSLEEFRVALCSQLAVTLSNMLESGFFATVATAAAAQTRAHALYDEALAILRRHKRWGDVATMAQNQANLLQRQFDAGDAAAAGRAHALYDEALAIFRRHERWVEEAMTGQNKANLLQSQFEAGDAAAAGGAHALYDEVLAILRRHECWADVATTAKYQAVRLIARLDAGDMLAVGHAHALFDEALAIFRQHERWGEVAATGQLQAALLVHQFDVGDATVAGRAHALFDEALALFRQHRRWLDVAKTAENQALLLLFQFEAGDAVAAGRAHALYDEALAILRQHERWVDVATTAQNQANLLQRQFELGDAAAAGRAHALYDEALAILRQHERWVDVATTVKDQANLMFRQFEAGDATAAVRAHPLLDEALAIFRQRDRWVDVAATGQLQAALLARQFEAGDAAVAGRAHALYDEALAILRSREHWLDVATTAQNQAVLLRNQFSAGDAAAAGRAHALYDEALAILRRHERWLDVATTAQNQAILLARQFEAGDAAAAGRAHALFDEALAIRRQHEHWIEMARTAQNQANLLTSQFEAGDAAAAGRAHALYDEALVWLPFDAVPIPNLAARRNLLRLLLTEGDHRRVADLGAVILGDVRHRLPGIAAPRNRRRLLQEIANLGQRAAAAALALGEVDHGLALMEAGRMVELGQRLRDAEAALSPDHRASLDDARAELDAAGAAYERALHALGEANDAGRDEAHFLVKQAEAALSEQATAFAAVRSRCGLDLAPPRSDAAALRKALGPDTTLVVPWFGRREGGMLILAPGRETWHRLDLPDMTHSALLTHLERWFAWYHHFHRDDADAVAAVDDGRQALWRLLMGPLHRALAGLGAPPAHGAALAADVLLCAPPELSVLPLAAAADPETGLAFLDDYALRLVPSLQTALSTAARAARPGPRTLVAVTNPQDDLGVHDNPALSFFHETARIDLTGYRDDPGRPTTATADALRASVAARRPGCFSFYGHGGWDPSDPDNSAIYLAAPLDADGAIPRETTDRGRWRTVGAPVGAAALQELELGDCRIAVLAGCETGMIDLRRNPDEHLGLPAALLQAGAAAVLSTLWPVEAKSTYAAVTWTLASVLDEGVSPAQALRRTQMRLRDDPDAGVAVGAHLGPRPAPSIGGSTPCPRPSPLWAAFTLVGA